MVGADDDRPAPLRIGGWVPPTGRRAARLEDATATATATALLPVLTPTDPDPPAQAAAPDESGRQSGPRRAAAGVRRWRVAALVAVATVAAAVGVPLLVSRDADQPGPDRQVQPAPQRPTRAPDAPVDPSPVAEPTTGATRTPATTANATRSATGLPAAPPSTPGPPLAPDPPVAPDQPLQEPAAPPPPPPSLFTTSLEAEGPAAERRGRADIRALAAASGGAVVTGIGDGSSNTVRFPQVVVPTAGRYTVTLYYVSTQPRSGTITVNGQQTAVSFADTGSADGPVGSVSVGLSLRAGANTIELGNRRSRVADLDRIVVTGSAG